MDGISNKENFQSKLVTRSYALLFIVIAFWTSAPVLLFKENLIETNYQLGAGTNLTFALLCVIAGFGILNKDVFFGRLLGLSLLSCILAYQCLKLITDAQTSPLLIFSLLNFCIIIVLFEKIIPKKNPLTYQKI